MIVKALPLMVISRQHVGRIPAWSRVRGDGLNAYARPHHEFPSSSPIESPPSSPKLWLRTHRTNSEDTNMNKTRSESVLEEVETPHDMDGRSPPTPILPASYSKKEIATCLSISSCPSTDCSLSAAARLQNIFNPVLAPSSAYSDAESPTHLLSKDRVHVYVSDLAHNVTDAVLYNYGEMFGRVVTAKVIISSPTRPSYRYSHSRKIGLGFAN